MLKTHTPWGAADSRRVIAPGIISYDTPSHGGINLSIERIAQMPEELRHITPYAGPAWYEEDCDWAIVTLAFPEHFESQQIAAAVGLLMQYRHMPAHYLHGAAEWLCESATGAALQAVATTWRHRSAHLFRSVVEGGVPRRYEALAAKLQATLDTSTRHNLRWAALRRITDGAEAEALLLPGDARNGLVDLSTIPAARILRQPITQGASK